MRWLIAAGVALAAVTGSVAQAHSDLTPMLTHWTFNPTLLSVFLVSAIAYARGQRILQLRLGAKPRRQLLQLCCFSAAWLCLALSLVSPLDFASDYSFAAHMTQHELLMMIAAPLLCWARPLEVYLWALPQRQRDRVILRLRQPLVQRTLHVALAPAIAVGSHALVRWTWHIPFLFEAALTNEWIHGFQHFTFFASAVWFWWAVMQGRYGKLGYGVSVVFVLATALHTGALGALITLARRPWYALYVPRSAAWHIDSIIDQQLAGLIMWIAAGTIFIGVGLTLMAAWLRALERRSAASASISAVNGAQQTPARPCAGVAPPTHPPA